MPGKLTGLDPETGAVLWTADAQGATSIVAPLRIDDHRLVLTASSTVLFDLAAGTGGIEATSAFKAPAGSSLHLPMLHDGHLFLIAGGGMMDGGFGGRGGRAAGRGATGRLVCLDLEGNETWRSGADTAGYGTGNVLLADGALYIQDGYTGALRVVEASAEGYHLLAEADLFGGKDARGDQQCWAPMALSDGRLLLRSQEELKCVDLRAGAGRP